MSIYRGLVIEIEHHEVFRSKFHKLINSIVCGEPYQLAHQTAEYLVRVEEPSPNGAGRIADFFLYGNYMGRLYPGDEVEISAKIRRRRLVAKKIYNVSTDSDIRPGLQIPAVMIRGVAIIALMVLIGFGLCIYGMGQSGELSQYAVYGGIVIGGFVWIKNRLTNMFKRR